VHPDFEAEWQAGSSTFGLYKFLYTKQVHSARLPTVTEPAPPDLVFLGDSKDIIGGFPADVREDLGGDLRRLQRNQHPLDSAPMGSVLPGVFELRADDKDFWYRVVYHMRGGVVYVLHCFTKKTNKTHRGDIELARRRLGDLKQQLTKTKKR
jgi:phage-related protein